MRLISESTTPAPVAKTARKPRWRPSALILFGISAGALALLAGVADSASSVKSWFSKTAVASSYYVVEPVHLSLMLMEDGELKPVESIDVKCQVEGESTILYLAPESSKVAKGDLLVELASDEVVEKLEREEIELKTIQAAHAAAVEDLEIQRNQNESDLRAAQIELEVAKLDYKMYMEGDYKQELAGIEIDIKQTKADIARQKEELEKNKRLLERKFVTPLKIEELEFDLAKAEMTLVKHELSLEILEDYGKPKNEMQKRSAMDRAQEELTRVAQRNASREKQAVAKVEQNTGLLKMRENRVARLRDQLKNTKIFAPADGIIQYPSEDSRWGDSSRIAVGQKVREGQTLVVLPNTSRMLVSTRIHEADRHRARVGLHCIVKVPAVPGQTFTGVISKIDRFADSNNRWLNPELKEHTTEILLDQTDAPLSPGDSAEVRVLIDEIDDAIATPVQTVISRGPRSFVFVKRGGEPEPVEVKLGRSTNNMVEVLEGLEIGDRVLLRVDDELLAKLPAPTAKPDESLTIPGAPPHASGASKNPGRARMNAKKPGPAKPGDAPQPDKAADTETVAVAAESPAAPDETGPAPAGQASEAATPAPSPTPAKSQR